MKAQFQIDPIYLVYYAAVEQAHRETGQEIPMTDRENFARDLYQIIVTLETWAWAGSSDLETTKGGYLRGHYGGLIVLVPFHLIEHFPFVETGGELADFARTIRVSKEGYICVSGSAAVLRSVGAIGDIDYCEYLEAMEENETEALRAQMEREESLVFVRMKWADFANDVRPWRSNVIEKYREALAQDSTLATASWKTDSLTVSANLGPIAVTNVILPQGSPVNSLAFDERSWVYQEAILTEDVDLRVNLAEPKMFGRYLLWLREQISEFVDEKPLKAAKRALSLCMILSFRDEEALLALGLQAPILVEKSRYDALLEARRFAELSESDLPAQIRRALEEAVGPLTPDHSRTQDALQFCREAASLAADRFDMLFGDALLVVAEEMYG